MFLYSSTALIYNFSKAFWFNYFVNKCNGNNDSDEIPYNKHTISSAGYPGTLTDIKKEAGIAAYT